MHDALSSDPRLRQPSESADAGVTAPRTTAQIKPSGAKLAANLSIVSIRPQ
jgi:hypothetical protein